VLLPQFTASGHRAWTFGLRHLTLAISAIRGTTAPVASFVVRAWARRRTIALVLAGVLAAAWGTGFFLFVGNKAVAVTAFPALEAHPTGEHNLVAYRLGTTVRASSYVRDPFAPHHPAYLIDGRAHPTLQEKWVSAPEDKHPWVELLWSGSRQVGRVVIRHAGSVEASALTAREYTLTCLQAQGAPPPLVARNNRAPVAEHALACSGARGVRVDFVPNRPGEMVRVFEIEVWGR
jgi:hypothetical protein